MVGWIPHLPPTARAPTMRVLVPLVWIEVPELELVLKVVLELVLVSEGSIGAVGEQGSSRGGGHRGAGG